MIDGSNYFFFHVRLDLDNKSLNSANIAIKEEFDQASLKVSNLES